MKNPEGKPIEQDISEDSLPEYLKMYAIEGQDPITEHSFDRYTADKKRFETDPRGHIFDLIDAIKNAPDDRRADFIMQALNSNNLLVQKMASGMIGYAEDEKTINLKNKVFDIITQALNLP